MGIMDYKKLNINKTILIGIINRIWLILSGPITIFLVLCFFTEITQGYFYTFRQLLALKVFTELGLGTVIIQFVSHEWAHLSLKENGKIEGPNEAKQRLASITRYSFKWFTWASILLFIILLVVGFNLFGSKTDLSVNWIWPWVILSVFTVFELLLIPFFSILTGCNDVFFVYLLQLIKTILNALFIWFSIMSGFGIWSLAIGASISFSVIIVILGYYKKPIFKEILKIKIANKFVWKKELWSMQWKIALSWLSGYFVFYLFTPVLFHFKGPVIAGQMGMSLSVVNTLAFIPSLWMKPNMPQFGMYIAKKNYYKLDALFFKLLKITSFFLLLSSLVLWSAFYIINYYEFSFAARMLPMPLITLLILTVTLKSGFSPFSDYLRAHKKEPMVIPSVLSAI